MGEYAMSWLCSPIAAEREFGKAASEGCGDPALAIWAGYDTALAVARTGNYHEASRLFAKCVSTEKFGTFDKSLAWRWQRQMDFRAAYHDKNAKLGIPEPASLDKQCGVLALRAAIAPYASISQEKLDNLSHNSGLGNSIDQLAATAIGLGYHARVVQLTDAGLSTMPVPVVTFVEQDHFTAILRTDSKYVTLLCPDCSRVPFRVTWRQWHALDPEASLVVCRKGDTLDRALALALKPHSDRKQALLVHYRVRQSVRGIAPLAMRLAGQVRTVSTNLINISFILPPIQALRASYSICDGAMELAGERKPWQHHTKDGDPVDLATGEMTHDPAADLAVYNPIGPSVKWSRSYSHLYDNGFPGTVARNDFGNGWSQPYNMFVYDPSFQNYEETLSGSATYLAAETYDTLTSGLTWQILSSGTVIASSSSTNGWNVTSRTAGTCYVTAPSGTTGNGYYV
jgi:hypothetical protein